MLPILFKLGPITIYSYGFCLALGYLIFTFLVFRNIRREYFDEEKVFDVVFVTTIMSVLGARLFYIIEHFDTFGFSLLNWILVNARPGFSLWGGLGVGLAFLLLMVKRTKLPLFQMFDLITIPLAVLYIFGEIGSFLAGSEVGLPTNLPWGIIFFSTLKRHPISLYEVIFSILLLVFLLRLKVVYASKKTPSGIYFLSFLISESLILFLLTFLKEDAIVVGRFIKIDHIAYFAIILAGVIVIYQRLGRNLDHDLVLLKTKLLKKVKFKKNR